MGLTEQAGKKKKKKNLSDPNNSVRIIDIPDEFSDYLHFLHLYEIENPHYLQKNNPTGVFHKSQFCIKYFPVTSIFQDFFPLFFFFDLLKKEVSSNIQIIMEKLGAYTYKWLVLDISSS